MSDFEKVLERIMNTPSSDRTTGFKVPPGPSIIELINDEINRSIGDYKAGVEHALWTIQQANRAGNKPFYALKRELAVAQADGNSEFTRGFRTAIFIFETPYKWLAGERP